MSNIYIYDFNIYANCHISYLCPDNKKSTEGSFKSKPPTASSQTKEDSDVMMRCFTINEITRGVLSVRQKDCKFYFQGKVEYKYIWIRAILLLK